MREKMVCSCPLWWEQQFWKMKIKWKLRKKTCPLWQPWMRNGELGELYEHHFFLGRNFKFITSDTVALLCGCSVSSQALLGKGVGGLPRGSQWSLLWRRELTSYNIYQLDFLWPLRVIQYACLLLYQIKFNYFCVISINCLNLLPPAKCPFCLYAH